MRAIKRGKIYANQRVNLGEAAPLDVPFSVQIDVCSACNMKCRFCFHSDLDAIKKGEAEFGYMSYELFTKIIDDMRMAWGGREK